MTTDTLFKFVNVRPVQRSTIPPDAFATFGPGETQLQAEIAALPQSDSREAIKLARDFMDSNYYLATAVPVLAEATAAAAAQASAGQARQRVRPMLGETLADWLKLPTTIELKGRLWDSVLAQSIVPNVKPDDRNVLYPNVRHLYALEYLATQPDGAPPLSLDQIRALRIVLPRKAVPAASRPSKTEDQRISDAIKRITQRLEEIQLLRNAASEVRKAHKILRAHRPSLISLRPSGVAGEPTPVPTKEIEEATALVQPLAPADAAAGQTVQTILMPRRKSLLQDPRAQELMSESTRKLLAERPTALLGRTALEIAGHLETEAHSLASTAVNSLPRRLWGALSTQPAWQQLVAISANPFGPIILPGEGSTGTPVPKGGGVPEERGLRPLGIGDLIVVKQELLRYAAGEVAHIENVLKSEGKLREHSRLREVEDTTVIETEELEETEKDQQSTERYELQKETQTTVESTMSFDAGVSVTANYGAVSITAHADFALENSTTTATKTASTFARDVTERSLSRIQRRAREERTRRVLETYSEKNEHRFDNTAGKDHVIGIYRWVDKYYRARAVNYGRRLMFEFIIPEPAAFYLYFTNNRPVQGVTVPKPPEPLFQGSPLKPGNLLKSNYTDYVALYNVQDMPVYPEESIRVGAACKSPSSSSNNTPVAETSEKLVCPPDYEVDDVYGGINSCGSGDHWISVLVAGEQFGNITATDVENVVPISVVGWTAAFHVNVVAICSLKQEAIRKWQLKAYEAITSAYQRALTDYNSNVAAVQIQQGVAVQGRNPDLNRKLERDELRKSALRMFTDDFQPLTVSGTTYSHFGFEAMKNNGAFGYPEFDTERAHLEGKVIQFFEQAMEWNNMVYRFYPYFWGRMDTWDERYPLTDTDPMFTDFLRAGAARVVVPVAPAYTESVLHYIHTAKIWNGGEPPVIDDPLYVSIIVELRSDAEVNDSGEGLEQCSIDSTMPCIVSEWDIKVPTTLIYLQPGSELPVFEESATSAGFGELAAKLDAKARDAGQNLNWRHSIVDLLNLLGRESSLSARRAMASKHGYGGSTRDTSRMNTWLHARLIDVLVRTGGILPEDF